MPAVKLDPMDEVMPSGESPQPTLFYGWQGMVPKPSANAHVERRKQFGNCFRLRAAQGALNRPKVAAALAETRSQTSAEFVKAKPLDAGTVTGFAEQLAD